MSHRPYDAQLFCVSCGHAIPVGAAFCPVDGTATLAGRAGSVATKRLQRRRANRLFGGVLAGLAAYLRVSVVALRLICVVVAIVGALGVHNLVPILIASAGYASLWALLPEENPTAVLS
jgi:phage shock protein PspC (stress-responsive transcriptional regulator)